MHYQRWQAGADMHAPAKRGPGISFEQRFWAKVNKDGPVPKGHPDLGPCWLWTGAHRNQAGAEYGFVGYHGKSRGAHRVSWELATGRLAGALHILHRCDVPGCVNPAHLFEGTHTDNMRDMMSKGREGGIVRARKTATHCKRGHEYTAENTRWVSPIWRRCKACDRITRRARRQTA